MSEEKDLERIVSPYSWLLYDDDEQDESRIIWFDTSLRDGEQVSGASMNSEQKVMGAKQLMKTGVDAIEAGFAISSKNEIDSISKIVDAVGKEQVQYSWSDIDKKSYDEKKDVAIFSLARCEEKDIDAAYEAVKKARLPGIHTFIATSEDHMKTKFKSQYDKFVLESKGDEDEAMKKMKKYIKQKAVDSVKYAKKKFDDFNKKGLIEFSCEAASATDIDFAAEVYSEVIKAGANIINVPDTEGKWTPKEASEFSKKLDERLKNVNKKFIKSFHGHNDKNRAVDNSLECIECGFTQIEGATNGNGERAGNVDGAVVGFNLIAAPEIYKNKKMAINFKETYRTSVLFQALTGYQISRNYVFWGENFYTHSSGIHASGCMKGKKVGAKIYEQVDASFFGAPPTRYTLTRRSGKASIANRIEMLGYSIPKVKQNNVMTNIYDKFIDIAETKRVVTDFDLIDIIEGYGFKSDYAMPFKIVDFSYSSKGFNNHSATISLNVDGKMHKMTSSSKDGPVDAMFGAIKGIIGNGFDVMLYNQINVGIGAKAESRASIVMDFNKSKLIRGEGYSNDIVYASALAVIDALNEDKIIQYYNRNQEMKKTQINQSSHFCCGM